MDEHKVQGRGRGVQRLNANAAYKADDWATVGAKAKLDMVAEAELNRGIDIGVGVSRQDSTRHWRPSAVGHYAAQLAIGNWQLAIAAGARVIATVGSTEKARHALSAGVQATIQYKSESVPRRVKELTDGHGADAIVDMDFSTTINWIQDGVLAPHGKLACYGSNVYGDILVPFRVLLFSSICMHFFLVYDLRQDDRRRALEQLTQLLQADRLVHTIGARFWLDDIAAVHEAVKSDKLIGNVIVDLE